MKAKKFSGWGFHNQNEFVFVYINEIQKKNTMTQLVYSESGEVVTQEQMDEMISIRLKAFLKENPQFVTAMSTWKKNDNGDLEMKITGLKQFP